MGYFHALVLTIHELTYSMKLHRKIQVPYAKSHVAIINYTFSLSDIRINVKLSLIHNLTNRNFEAMNPKKEKLMNIYESDVQKPSQDSTLDSLEQRNYGNWSVLILLIKAQAYIPRVSNFNII